jgi:hypothetical protein
MARKFGRFAKVIVRDGNKERTYEGLNVGFNGFRTSDLHPQELELSIYQLNEDSRKFVTQKYANIEVYAGYKEHNGLIFKGAVQFGSSRYESGDWITAVTLRDGDLHWKNIFINEVFAKGTPHKTIIEALFKKLTGIPENIQQQFQEINQAAKGQADITPVLLYPKLKKQTGRRTRSKEPPPLPAQIAKRQAQIATQRQKATNIKTERDKLFEGAAARKLKVFCDSLGLEAIWDLQTLNILSADTALAAEAIEISPDSGLINTPEPIVSSVQKNYQSQKFENGWKFECDLDHALAPGHLVYLNSSAYQGVLLIKRIEYPECLKRGGAWKCSIEGMPYAI